MQGKNGLSRAVAGMPRAAAAADGQADTVALARGIMDDPRWAWHAARALGAETAYPDMYIRCHPSRWPGPPVPRAAE